MHDQSKSSITRAVAWLVCSLLYYTGDAVSHIVYLCRWSSNMLMPVYAWIMLASVMVNDAYGLSVWDDPDDY
jgi:hypothetical protein